MKELRYQSVPIPGISPNSPDSINLPFCQLLVALVIPMGVDKARDLWRPLNISLSLEPNPEPGLRAMGVRGSGTQFENHLPGEMGHHMLYFITLLWLPLVNSSTTQMSVLHLYKREETFYCSHRMPAKGKMMVDDFPWPDSSCQGMFCNFRTFGEPCKKIIFHCPGVYGAQ